MASEERPKVDSRSVADTQPVGVVNKTAELASQAAYLGQIKMLDVRNVAKLDVPIVPDNELTPDEVRERSQIIMQFQRTPPLMTVVTNEKGATRIVVMTESETVLRLIRLGQAVFPVSLITAEQMAQAANKPVSEVITALNAEVSQRLKTPLVAMIWRVDGSLDSCLSSVAETR